MKSTVFYFILDFVHLLCYNVKNAKVKAVMTRTPNEQQKKVIEDLDNNIILFASAGTGKTFTIANRVANILQSDQAKAEEILCLTFTIKACNEMQEDIFSYAGSQAKEVNVNTIHSFCYKLLLEEGKRLTGKYSELGVCDEVDQEEILKSILSSRFRYWLLEKELSDLGINMPDLQKCEVCQRKDSDLLFFMVEDKLITSDGEIYDAPEDKSLLASVEVICPICGEKKRLINRKCIDCGNEFIFTLSKKKFEIFNKRTALRNFVSEIKHVREELALYTENQEEDIQRSFIFIKENKREIYESLISYYARYLGQTPDEEFERAMESFVGKFITEYDEYLLHSNLADFDDLIIKSYAYLCDEERNSYWSCRYKYIIVDEMQDTSALEYKVLKKIFAQNNVMLCGDFFQTIYEWRGSNPEQILGDYIKEFSAKTYMLSENYRATKMLAGATFGYLKNTYPQWMGKYCPEELSINSQTDGDKIACYAFDNPDEEAWQIYKYLQSNKNKGLSNICIIARSNKYIAELYNRFENFNAAEKTEEQLRFFTVEENFNFFKKPVIKDILAVLRLLVNRCDRASMERLTEKYVRNVGIKTIETLRGYNNIGVSIISFIDPQTYHFGDVYHRLIDAYQAENIIVYDTETTGLDLSKDEIVQISAIKINREGEIIDKLDLMVEPNVPISQVAYETHGFDLEYIKANGGLTAKEALTIFSKFVKGGVLVGHNNLAYDNPLVERQLKENELPPLEILAEYDTLVIAKQFYAALPDFTLSTLCLKFNVINECAHNALGDITATGKCLISMLKESILPTAMERISILMKYRSKFEKIYEFIEEMRIRLQNDEELAQYIIERLRLIKHYPSNADMAAMRDIVESLRPSGENQKEFLKGFLRDAALASSQMDILIKKLDRVPIITVHQAKGCEFDTVIIAGADDNHFPSYAARQSGQEEEEKKVFYVAISRAKKKLILTRAMRNGRYKINETPYFWMIPSEYVWMNQAWKNGN